MALILPALRYYGENEFLVFSFMGAFSPISLYVTAIVLETVLRVLITIFFLATVQVILVPYCCLFRVLSNDMLNVSIDASS